MRGRVGFGTQFELKGVGYDDVRKLRILLEMLYLFRGSVGTTR